MSYCYCTPSRNLRQLAPGTSYGGYSSWASGAVMGTKGDWVERTRREGAIKGWMTRRANLARKERERIEAAKAKAEAEKLTPFVIEGTVPADTIAAEPVAITTK